MPKRSSKADEAITTAQLAHSRIACGRVERAIWQALTQRNITTRTPADAVITALTTINATPPDWCTPEAWTTYCRTLGRWARVFGSLEVFQRLGTEPEVEAMPHDELIAEAV